MSGISSKERAFHRVRAALPSWSLLFVLLVVALLALAPSRPSPSAAAVAGGVDARSDSYPGLEPGGCNFLPDPRSNVSFPCGTDNYPGANPAGSWAFVGAPVRLNLSLADPNGENMTVTVRFDAGVNYDDFSPEPGNLSAVSVVNVTSPGAGVPVPLELNWTYDGLNPNFPISESSSYHLVWIVVNDTQGNDTYDGWGCPTLSTSRYGQCFFTVAVVVNRAPTFTESLATNYQSTVTFPDPVVAPFSQYVIARDGENDNITATWDWGDGSQTVEQVSGDTMDGVTFWGNHTYQVDTNTTPRDYYFYINVTLSDGIPGHENRSNATMWYHVNFDDAPNLQSLAIAQSTWRVGQAVRAESRFSDGDSDNVTYYWDLGDGSSTAPVTVRASPAPTPVNVTHVYTSPGSYTIALWATDGEGKCVWGGDACLRSHEVNASQTIEVIGNAGPTVSLTLSAPPQFTGRPAGFTVALFDRDGDPLNLTWYFGDGTWLTNYTNATAEPVHALSTGVQLSQNHTYLRPGPPPTYNYTVRVWADDGHGHNVSSSTRVFVGSTNMPPVILAHLDLTNNTAFTNGPFTLHVTVSDPEGDRVNVTVDWGDSTALGWKNVSLLPGVNETVVFLHTYRVSGARQINVTATDYQVWVMRDANGTVIRLNHTVVVPVSITVQAPPQPTPPDDWTWVDYSTLSAVLAVPVGLTVRAAYRRRQERKEE